MQTRAGLFIATLKAAHSLIIALAVAGNAAADVTTQPAQPATSPAAESTTARGEEVVSCDALAAKAAAAAGPADRCEALLKVARCILDTECSIALTRELCGTGTEGVSMRAAATKALAQLESAEKALEETKLDDETAEEARGCISVLRTFATVFQSLGEVPTTGPARDELLTACAALAEYFDDPRGGVAEAAKLWQGVAYRRAGRTERALQVLRPVLTAPGARRVGLWSRLERCRALGDQREYAAAVALTLRLSARVDAWFEEEDAATRRQAADSVRWVRISLLRDWARKLKEDGLDERAKEAEEDADRVLGSDAWPPGVDQWLSVGPPVPGLPEVSVKATSPTTSKEQETGDEERDEERRKE
jgi:hypothetical protein